MARNRDQHPRVRWVGAIEVSFVAIALLVLASTVLYSWLAARAAAAPAQDAISAEMQRYPITDVSWRRAVDVPFGTVDLPGQDRRFGAGISGADGVTAVAVGGHRKGIATAEIRYVPGSNGRERVQQQGDLAGDLFRELGLEPSEVKMIVSDSDATYRQAVNVSQIGSLGTIRLAPAGLFEGTVLRISIVSQDRRKVMVASTWPIARPDPFTDRVVRTVRIGG